MDSETFFAIIANRLEACQATMAVKSDEYTTTKDRLHNFKTVGRARGRLPMLTVSLNSFVPKAWTPFQFCAFAGVPELKEKIKFLRGSALSLRKSAANAEYWQG